MKIAIFYPINPYASWYSLGGYKLTLERMGHTVVNAALPGNNPHSLEFVKPLMPTIDELNSCDMVFLMYAEWINNWLSQLYGYEGWANLRVPVVSRFDESFDRGDIGLPERWKELRKWSFDFSFPAHQDAKRYGGEYLPYGADTTFFKPSPWKKEPETGKPIEFASGTEKLYEIGFVGSMYPIRLSYVEKLAGALPNNLTFHSGPCFVTDLKGVRGPESTRLMVDNIHRIKVFFCLPPMSRLMVCKAFEVMGCGTFLMYPKLPGDARRNNEIFEDGKHLVYYDYGRIPDNAKQIQKRLADDKGREEIARAGMENVHKNFTLEQMLDKLIAQAVASKERVAERVAACGR